MQNDPDLDLGKILTEVELTHRLTGGPHGAEVAGDVATILNMPRAFQRPRSPRRGVARRGVAEGSWRRDLAGTTRLVRAGAKVAAPPVIGRRRLIGGEVLRRNGRHPR